MAQYLNLIGLDFWYFT